MKSKGRKREGMNSVLGEDGGDNEENEKEWEEEKAFLPGLSFV